MSARVLQPGDRVRSLHPYDRKRGRTLGAVTSVSGAAPYPFRVRLDGDFVEGSYRRKHLRYVNVGVPDRIDNPEPVQRSAGAALVHGDREGSCGDPTVNFTRIAGMWSALIGADISPRDVALMMVCLKVSREYGSHKADNLDGIEGYVECSRLIEKGQQ